ncbi:hypothetical protein EYB31_14845 [Paenibacillus thalictri]|uniref:Uncharacterized protein n=2 Tax=Paenibacillus thalictri TaxID=2527873 RepID=A0A4Q9DPF5_9BACL|nr:hypothetical protein EYB31_14845 [Paenibacillus thalictri]
MSGLLKACEASWLQNGSGLRGKPASYGDIGLAEQAGFINAPAYVNRQTSLVFRFHESKGYFGVRLHTNKISGSSTILYGKRIAYMAYINNFVRISAIQ